VGPKLRQFKDYQNEVMNDIIMYYLYYSENPGWIYSGSDINKPQSTGFVVDY